MAFLDDFGKKFSAAVDVAADTAKDLAEAGKLKLDIATEEKEVQKLYAQIGQAVFEEERENEESRFLAECTWIKEHLDRINQLKQTAEKEK